MTSPFPVLEPHSLPRPQPEPAGSPHLAAALFALLRAVRARRLLDAVDPRVGAAIEDTTRALRAALGERDALRFTIDERGLRAAESGERVEGEAARGVAELCRSEGARELVLSAGDASALVALVERLALGEKARPPSRTDEIARAEPEAELACDAGTAAELDTTDDTETTSSQGEAEAEDASGTLPCHAADEPAGAEPVTAPCDATPALASPAAAPELSHAPAATPECVETAEVERPLDELIELACGPDPRVGIAASQALLRRGAEVVPELLRRVASERDERRRGHLCGVLIVMGERATPLLVAAIRGDDGAHARMAAWIAGEIQDPSAVAPLATALRSDDATLRREAARALAKISHPGSIAALDSLFDRGDDESASLAAWCLAAASGARPLAVLRGRLRDALAHPDFGRAREIVHALARRASPDCVQDLAAIFDQRSLLHRRALRELKLSAVRALAKIPGEATERALRDAVAQRDGAVREVALALLTRRAGAARAA